jgi:glycosyltransferase involved in cell wall biosynthesis
MDRRSNPPPSASAGPRVAIVTAGAGGMYCGSCLEDNLLAAALTRLHVDVQLIPTYTPIRTDEEDVSIDRVFLGGINVALRQRLQLFRSLPARLTRWLDNPRLLRWVAQRGIELRPSELGELTVSMLRGENDYLRRDIEQLRLWLEKPPRPQVVQFSDVLIASIAAPIKHRMGIPVVVTLQGDDIFLEGLAEPHRTRALNEITRIDSYVDLYVVHSRFYAERMAMFLGLPSHKFRIIPLGVNSHDLHTARLAEPPANTHPLAIGYLARIAPEKGLHLLAEAFLNLVEQSQFAGLHLHVAGWQGKPQRAYVEEILERIRSAGRGHQCTHWGEVDRAGKRKFLHTIDVLSVPSPYPDPKGLYVLEALSAGVPVVQPRHGAFPELIERTGGGRLFVPNDVASLTESLAELLSDGRLRDELGTAGQAAVEQHHSAEEAARAMVQVYREVLRD